MSYIGPGYSLLIKVIGKDVTEVNEQISKWECTQTAINLSDKPHKNLLKI